MKQYFHCPKEGDIITKIRIHKWLNHETMDEIYGVQIKLENQDHRFYMHVTDEQGKPILSEDLMEVMGTALNLEDMCGKGTSK